MRTAFKVGLVASIATANKTKIQVLSEQVQAFNTGFTKVFMDNPATTSGPCVESMTKANEQIASLFDFPNYPSGEFDAAHALEHIQIMSIFLQNQASDCGVDEYVMRFDKICSNWSRFGGGLANLGVQIAFYAAGWDPMGQN